MANNKEVIGGDPLTEKIQAKIEEVLNADEEKAQQKAIELAQIFSLEPGSPLGDFISNKQKYLNNLIKEAYQKQLQDERESALELFKEEAKKKGFTTVEIKEAESLEAAEEAMETFDDSKEKKELINNLKILKTEAENSAKEWIEDIYGDY